MRSDEELMEEVASGQFEAFEEIARRHQKTAFGVAYHLLEDSKRAEEIAQEAFLKILRNAEGYEPTARFKTYLIRVVTRLCYDRTEKNKPLSLDPQDGIHESSSDVSPLENMLASERDRTIQEAIYELPPRQRVAIVLQHFEEFTYEEIADAMETTEKAVEGLLSRARGKLKNSLVHLMETE